MIDTHLHLFDPERHAFAADAIRPPDTACASMPALLDLLDMHQVQRAWLVAPTVGYNHAWPVLLAMLRESPSRLRGVARLRGDEDDATLRMLRQGGVIGVRLDLRHDGAADLDRHMAIGSPARWAACGWFVQVQAEGAEWAQVANRLADWPLPIVVDHCGWPDTRLELTQPGFAAVLALGRSGHAWVKLSGGFRFSQAPWPHADTDRFVHALLEAYGAGRCLWGSDWPFVRLPRRLDYGHALALLHRWVPPLKTRQAILHDNAAALWHGLDG